MNTIIIFGDVRTGKTRASEIFKKKYKCKGIVDDWLPKKGLEKGHLHLFTTHKKQFYFEGEVRSVSIAQAIKEIGGHLTFNRETGQLEKSNKP